MDLGAQRLDGGKPPDLKPHLAVKLFPGWVLDSANQRFLTSSGKSFAPAGDLPRRSRIVYTASDLDGRDPSSLRDSERELSRHVQVILPRGTDPAEYIARIQRWECVEEVTLPPEPRPAGIAPRR